MEMRTFVQELNTNIEALFDHAQAREDKQLAQIQTSMAEGFKVLETSVAALAGKTLTVQQEPAPKTLLAKVLPWLVPGLVVVDLAVHLLK